MNYNETKAIVEECLLGLGVKPGDAAGKLEGQWAITYKGSTVWIDVFNNQATPDKWYIQVMSPMTKVPIKQVQDIYRNLLEINGQLYGCWICKKGDWIYVTNLREADGLDRSELDATLDRVAFYCNDYHSKLLFKFEGCFPSDTDSGDSGGSASDN